MPLDLYAGVPVTDLPRALTWYEKLFGTPATFLAGDTEAVWDLAEHRAVFLEVAPEHAGHARHSIFVDDLEATVSAIAGRGLEPLSRDTYGNGVRKAVYKDPDGNEIGFGGAPV